MVDMGIPKTEVAARFEVSRQTLFAAMRRCMDSAKLLRSCWRNTRRCQHPLSERASMKAVQYRAFGQGPEPRQALELL